MRQLLHATAAACLLFLAACPAPPTSEGPVKKRDAGTTTDLFDPTSACGGPSGDCCAGGTCDPTLPLRCNTGKGTCCGTTTAECQVPGDCCNGLACSGNRCCADSQSACTDSNDCCAGLACVGGVCDKQNGGNVGQACSATAPCNAGSTCVSGMCKTCGAAGQTCCTGNTCTSKGVACNMTTMICEAPCGGANQTCCKTAPLCTPATLTCNASKICSDGTTGTTGGLNQPCKPNNVCNTAALSCVNNTCTTVTCTSVGATCCANSTCQGSNLVCGAGNKCVGAPSCTAASDACTSAAQCCSNLQCVLTANPGIDTARKQCCVGVNTACTDDFDCCGFLTCVNHACKQQPDGEYCLTNGDCLHADCDTTSHLCTTGSGMCTGGLPPGPTSVCSNKDQCCGDAACAPLQSQGGALRCCMPGSKACTTSSECCGTMLCTNKFCICKASTEGCLSDSDCCSGLVCGADKKCGTPGAPGPTVNPGGACTMDTQCKPANSTTYVCPANLCCTHTQSTPCVLSAECCDGYVCDYNTPVPGPNKVCCGAENATCRPGFGYDCCGSLICDNGKCVGS